MLKKQFDIIVIGGSAGSTTVLINILQALPQNFQIPIVIVLHRMKNVVSEMDKVLSIETALVNIKEPEDKESIINNNIYLAPQNYHLLIESNKTFSLDYSEQVNFSRPSIDVTFESAAAIFKEKALCILLSGANKDGTAGIAAILKNNGTAFVQSPSSAEYTTMPQAAIQQNFGAYVLDAKQIPQYLLNITI